MRRLLREPLVHFLLIGAVLFGLYSLTQSGRPGTAPSKEIRLSLDEIAQLTLLYQSQWRRPPTPQELERMVENKVQQEILYREALAMGLDKDDEIVKRRMAQKMQFLAEDVAAAREPTTAELRSWFEKNSARFAQPPRLSFRHLYFSPDRRGARARDDAEQALAKLAGQPVDAKIASSLADPFMFQDYYRDRAPDYLGKEFGPPFALAVGQASARLVAGADRVRLRLAPRVRRHRDSRPRTGLRGDRARRQDRVARRAEGAGLGEGVQGDARQVHGAAARAARAFRGLVVFADDERDRAIGRGVEVIGARRIARYVAAALLVLLAGLPAARAHEARPAYLELKETAPGQFAVLWRTPVLAGMRLPLVLAMPDGVKDLKAPVVQELTDSLVERRWIDAGPNGLAGKRIEFAGLQFTITDVLVRVELLDGRTMQTIVRPSQPWVEIAAAQSRWEVMGTYVVEGIRHILFGADHLLFVLGLLLIVGNCWMLVKTVTAFTVAHSITLAIATLGYAEAPALPLNAAIALSILFLGPEIVRSWRGETSFTIRHPWVVAFAFGLLHGFGFATAMTSAGLPRHELPLALLSFNVGVEVGQLGFVALVLAMERSFRVLEIRWPRWVQALPGYTVGTLGAFWTIQRVALLIGALR